MLPVRLRLNGRNIAHIYLSSAVHAIILVHSNLPRDQMESGTQVTVALSIPASLSALNSVN